MKTLTKLSKALREQRKHLALNQKDMRMRFGMAQQQSWFGTSCPVLAGGMR